jgi:electron transport complex protein RnfB
LTVKTKGDPTVSDEIYERLATALDRLPNAFPRTQSNVEIEILKKIFSLDEASLISNLTGTAETAEEIAERIGDPREEVESKLKDLARRGLIWFQKGKGGIRFRLAPFMVGIFEASLDKVDHELAHLVEHYLLEGGAEGIMRPQPALHRVVPAQSSIKSQWILPYDDVRSILLSSKSFSVSECICRRQQEKLGSRRCDFPLDMCMTFSAAERSPGPDTVTKEEALATLDRAEEIGLVHTVSNVAKGIGYICNCCGCCCGILRGITEWGIEESVACANYYASVDADTCTGCGTCVDRCQVEAISVQDELAAVNRDLCIGCGLCVTGCPEEAASLELKPESERVDPPEDFAAWERERMKNRGMQGPAP